MLYVAVTFPALFPNPLLAQIHKSLLGYMGDKSMAFPATLAQDILQKGLEQPQLRDEIYLQIMKQLSSNPTADSIAKGWQVMCMCVSTFPPSMEFELYLLNFMHEQKKKKVSAQKSFVRSLFSPTLAGNGAQPAHLGVLRTLP